MRDVCVLPQISLMLRVHGWPSLATLLKINDFASRFEGAVDFDCIFAGAGRAPCLNDSGHLGPSLSKSMPPHEPCSLKFDDVSAWLDVLSHPEPTFEI